VGAPAIADRAPPPDNRWQRGAIVDALYLADEEDTAWAEWYRHLAEHGLPPNEQMPRELWLWEVDVAVANVSDPARLARVGLVTPRPGRRGWSPCQRVGEIRAGEGWTGLLARSAARPAHMVMCLFRADGGTIRGARPIPPSTRIDEPPAPPTGMTT
jgi:hypothetical protein